MINQDELMQIPAPGEPLKEDIHDDNKRLLESDLASRLELLKAKLSRRQIWSLNRRYKSLHQRLNRAGWNQLIKQRDSLAEQYAMLKEAYRKKPSAKLKKQALDVASKGKTITARLATLAPLANEFQDVAQRLDAHHRVVALEKEEEENRRAFYREAETWESQIYAVFRQSPRLHHVYKDKKGEYIRTPQIQRVLCTPDKIYYQVKTTRQGFIDRWFGAWHSALPYGVDISDLTSDETLDNLSAVCGRIVTVERSKRSQNLFYVVSRLDSADGVPNRVRYEQVIDHYPTDIHSKTPYPAGVGTDRKIQFFDFEAYPHVLIAGASGGGKSNLINQMVSTLITMNHPDELRLILVDNKGGVELSHFDGIPHLLAPIVKNTNDVLPALKSALEIMRQRLAAFLEAGAKNLESFNKKSKEKIPRIIMIVDEMATIIGLGDLTKDIHTELRTLTSQGRAVGIHMVICTQHPSVDVLPGWIKTNLTLRVASKMPNHVASQIIVDSISASILPDIPGRMVFRRGGFEMILQTPLIDDGGIARAVKLAKEFSPTVKVLSSADGTPDNAPAPLPPIPVIPKFGRDDFIKFALEKLDGKLSPYLIHQVIGNEVMGLKGLRKILDQLKEESEQNGGLIRYDGGLYRIKRLMNVYKLLPYEPPAEPSAGNGQNGLNGYHSTDDTDGIDDFERNENEPIVSLN